MLSRALNLGVFEDRGAGASSKPSENHGQPYEFLVVPPKGEHTATVIWLHGLGGTNRDILPYAEDVSDLPGLGHVKFILPQARKMAVTGNNNYVMPSWFDCYSFDIENREEDADGQQLASDLINDIILLEESDCGIPSSRVVVGGLSQGSAIALHVAVTTQRPLGGAFVLSGYVPQRRRITEIASPTSRTLPYFWGHGQLDRQVRYRFSLDSARVLAADLGLEFIEVEKNDELAEMGDDDQGRESAPHAKLKFYGYRDLVHWMHSEEMDDLGKWIKEVVPGSGSGASTTAT